VVVGEEVQSRDAAQTAKPRHPAGVAQDGVVLFAREYGG
jgi:hypothetical protein